MGSTRRFVVQEHQASTHHFDLRLEVDGVLVSWAVPKGPSTDPSEKRLAVRVDDHPMRHGRFEGVIPQADRGAGPVIVWDAGAYRNRSRDEHGRLVSMERALRDGRVEVELEGRKLRGGYALVHAKVGDDDRNWLLVKEDDDEADARRNPVSTEPRSVLTGRTLDEVREEEG